MTLEKLKRYGWTVFVVVILLISAVLGMFIIQFKDLPLSETADAWGQFGDYLGGTLNPFLAFLSFSALLFTIFIQLKQLIFSEKQLSTTLNELNLSRTELSLTRTELKRSADAQSDSKKVMEEQLLTQSLQQFDSTFFAMLRELNSLLLDLEKSAQGHESKLTKCHDAVINESGNSIQTQIIELLKDREISRFFMLLFQLLKIIDNKIDDNIYLKTDKSVTKKMYSNIVRASISEKAMQLLMINVLHENFKPYKELVEKFAFFEHTSFLKNERYNLLLVNIAFCYNPSAFDNSQYWSEVKTSNLYSKFIIINTILNYNTLYYKIFTDLDVRKKLQENPPIEQGQDRYFSCKLADNVENGFFKINLYSYNVRPYKFEKWICGICKSHHSWTCELYFIDDNTISLRSNTQEDFSFLTINFNEDGNFSYSLSEKIYSPTEPSI